MELSSLIQAINNLADEQESPEIVTEFINSAIAKINIECNADFPFLSITNPSQEPAFPEKWQRALLIPFGVGRIKQLDSSQFEYSDAYNEFLVNLIDFKTKYVIPEQYKDGTENKDVGDAFVKPPYFYAGW